jgi:hypothetical protein
MENVTMSPVKKMGLDQKIRAEPARKTGVKHQRKGSKTVGQM